MPRKAASASDRSCSSAHRHAGGGPLAVEIAASGLARLIAASADESDGEDSGEETNDPSGSREKESGSIADRLDLPATLPLSVPTGQRDESAEG